MILGNKHYSEVLDYFIKYPDNEIHLRGLTRTLGLPIFTVKKYVDIAVNENLIYEKKQGNLRIFKSNSSNIVFRHLKTTINLQKISGSGLIEYLEKNVPLMSSMTLFGSLAKGEDNEKSDIDIIIIGQNAKLSLRDYEKKLEREISIKIMKWSEWKKTAESNKPFYNDVIIYGISLFGEIPLV